MVMHQQARTSTTVRVAINTLEELCHEREGGGSLLGGEGQGEDHLGVRCGRERWPRARIAFRGRREKRAFISMPFTEEQVMEPMSVRSKVTARSLKKHSGGSTNRDSKLSVKLTRRSSPARRGSEMHASTLPPACMARIARGVKETCCASAHRASSVSGARTTSDEAVAGLTRSAGHNPLQSVSRENVRSPGNMLSLARLRSTAVEETKWSSCSPSTISLTCA
mmetsp:Transcript_17848/g.51160  ORF Transcript_17848/g.51160 Transcript_17848/m.51160 type:complete len:223 (-) Transcript_17848:267-935(-)